MRILVTGGAGFIGTHLCKRLLADGHDLTVVDNLSTGKRENIPPRATFVHADVTSPEAAEPEFAKGFDAVCHIAGQVSIIKSFSDPVADLRTNVEGTLRIMQLCLKYKVPHLIYASSMTAYGNCEAVPTPEREPCCPDSYYGITKHAAERYVLSTAERPDLGFEFSVTALRMFSVYGPGQALDNPYQGVLGIFIGKVMRGEPITIFGDGEQTRDFVFIADVIDGWAKAVAHRPKPTAIFNLGSGRSLSINQLAEYAAGAFGYAPGRYPIHHAAERPGEQRRVQADITEAQAHLGWKPQTTFEAGLAATVREGQALSGAEAAVASASGGTR
jgi:UDP-glucose 4-epimerase